MGIPGFTAEYSMDVYPQFSTQRMPHGRLNGGVFPALPPKHACSNLCGSDSDCYNQCLQALGGGGPTDPGNISCLVGCGPCQIIGGHRQRACVKPDCSVRYIRC